MAHPSRRAVLAASSLFAAGVRPAVAQTAPGAPIRIGCITALSGAQEIIGRPILTGAMIAADQINAAGGLLGRPVEVIAADARADPKEAVAQANRLMGDGINLLCGCVTSDVALAVVPLLKPTNSMLIGCSAQSDKLTHEAYTANFFRVTDQTYMRQRAQARLMAERYPDVVRWGAIIPDTEYGRSAYAAFRDGLMEYYPALAGHPASFNAPITAAFGATDFRRPLADIRESGVEGLFVAVYGGDAVGLYRQARAAGLLSQVRVLADSYNEFLVPMELGAGTPEHLWLAMTWYWGGYETLPMARALLEDYMRRTGNPLPPGFVASGHSAVHAYAAAIRKTGSTETRTLIAALEGLTMDTAKGPLTFRAADHQAICDVNFVRIRSSAMPGGAGHAEYMRADIEVAEFVRYDGATVIEPAAPGRAIGYRAVVNASR